MTIAEITSIVRSITNEYSQKNRDIFFYEGNRVFELGENNIIAPLVAVSINNVELGSSGAWSYNSTTNKLTFENSVTLTTDYIITVDYNYYPNFSDTEIKEYIKSAIVHISLNGYSTFTYDSTLNIINPETTSIQGNLIAMIASILMKPNNKTYRLPDITIQVPGTTLSTDEMIRKTIAVFKRNTHGVFSLVGGFE